MRWTATAGRETASILGGAYLPEEKRRRCRGIVLCAVLVMVPLLLTAAAVGLVFFEVITTHLKGGVALPKPRVKLTYFLSSCQSCWTVVQMAERMFCKHHSLRMTFRCHASIDLIAASSSCANIGTIAYSISRIYQSFYAYSFHPVKLIAQYTRRGGIRVYFLVPATVAGRQSPLRITPQNSQTKTRRSQQQHYPPSQHQLSLHQWHHPL